MKRVSWFSILVLVILCFSASSVQAVGPGEVYGWGRDDYGQATPPVGEDYIALAAGELHSLVLKSDGSIVGWGNDYYDQATPPAGTNFVAITACLYHSLALKSDGSIVGWGYNNYGQVD